MSKVICDICGTVFQDTADSCPICGYSRISGSEAYMDDILMEEAALRGRGGRFAQTTKKPKEIFDYDEVNPEEDEEEDDYDEDEDYEDKPRGNGAIITILVIVIILLLAATAFVFFRFFLPGITEEEVTVPATVETVPVETETEETTEPTIPCESLILLEAPKELGIDGKFLLNVDVKPADTTDVLEYESEDPSIATVTEDGRIEAVGEGQTTIYIRCGKQRINCPVTVVFVEETEPAATEETVEESVEETTKPVDITLALKKYDITLYVGYAAQLELDCDLEATDVEWSVEHDYIATVDENGLVVAVGYGTTAVTVKYGDQEVEVIIRCK